MPERKRQVAVERRKQKQLTQGTNCRDDSTYSPEDERSIGHDDDGEWQTYLFANHMVFSFNSLFLVAVHIVATSTCTLPTSTMQDFTPQNIKLHPELLLHKKNPDEKITAFDGALGGLYDRFIVTTPNMHTLYAPPLGNNHIMYLRSDLQYGDDDPLSWPQPYVSQFCHFPVICSVLLNPSESHPDAPLYWLPGKTDFYEADSASECRGPGFLLHQKFVWLQNRVNLTVGHGKSMTFSEGAEDLKRRYTLLLHDLLERLQYLPMSLEKVQLSVRETQHVTLYLRALIDYMLIYKPRMDAVPDGSLSRKADHELMGAYTSDPQVVQSFFRAGIPVWIIRPVDQLPNIRIDRVEHFQEPRFFMSLDQHRAKFCPIFKGHGLSAEKYYAFDKFMRSNVRFPNVFTWTENGGSSPAVNPPVPVPSSSSSRRDRKMSPYARQGLNNHLPSSKWFVDRTPAHLFLLPLVAVWGHGLSNLVFDKARCIGSVGVKPRGYALPPPSCLTTAENPSKIHSMFKFWLCIRVPMIARLSSTLYLPALMDQNSWKTLVSLDYLGKATQQENSDTKAAKRRDRMREFLKGCCDEIEMDVGTAEKDSVFWRGKPYSELTATDFQEVVWEISELEFRLELAELDRMVRVAVPNHDTARETAVSRCFAGPITIADVGSANMGLAHPNWFDRAPYLCSLHQLMQTWAGTKPEIIAKDKKTWLWTESEIQQLEKEVAEYYVDTFFLHFGRPPVLPRYLLHNPCMPFIPTPRIRGQTTTPNVHADISKWE
ncbi:hypothetical protein ARMSODRAFT_983466 [Armillaria solidipes]|uniref:Uncharacterized protein n=1 Tax=Armillaria solidipes TaxID=1076256 RepID=A0A2H3B2S7_9AGAR|nr:hypothetical protein ARMSODRAFT_983466 [Armillaria solidipes]